MVYLQKFDKNSTLSSSVLGEIDDCPGLRRSSSCWIKASSNSIPGGQPSTIPPMPFPCDSPKEVKVNSLPMVFDIIDC